MRPQSGLSGAHARLKAQRHGAIIEGVFPRRLPAAEAAPRSLPRVSPVAQAPPLPLPEWATAPDLTRVLAPLSEIASVVSWCVLSSVTILTLWVLIPTAVLGWSPILINSDSMAPAFRSGDIVLMKPSDGHGLETGNVIAYDDPSGAGRVSHRVYQVLPDGRYVTKGDANAVADSTPLDPERVEGVGRLVVPFVGLPLLWVQQRAWLMLAVAVTFLASVLWLSRSPANVEQPDVGIARPAQVPPLRLGIPRGPSDPERR